MSFVWQPLLPGGAQLQASDEVTGTGAATTTVAGSAAGLHGVAGSAAGSEAATGDADGLHGVAGTVTGSEGVASSATGAHGVVATAAGAESAVGSAQGEHPASVEGAASATCSVVAASAGVHGVTGAAACAESAVGVAQGSSGEVEPVAVSGVGIRRKRRRPTLVVGAAAARVTVRGSGIGSVQRPSSTGRATGALRPAAKALGLAFSLKTRSESERVFCEERDLADLAAIARLRGDHQLALLVSVLRDDLEVRRRRRAA